MKEQRYNVYKDGKKWASAAITVVTLGISLSDGAYMTRADTVKPVVSANSSTNTSLASEETSTTDASQELLKITLFH